MNNKTENYKITLRDQFAMAAMTGLLAGYGYFDKKKDRVLMPDPENLAESSFLYADSMMEQRGTNV